MTPPAQRAGYASPADGINIALATLTDVAGITGSFVFTNGGQLIAREIHAMFDNAVLAEAAQRLARLTETFEAVGDQLDLAVIRFRDYKLYLKTVTGGMLCILADQNVNMAALRMASNLVARRISPALERVEAAPQELFVAAPPPEPEPQPGQKLEPEPEPEPSLPPGATVVASGARRFGGRAVVRGRAVD